MAATVVVGGLTSLATQAIGNQLSAQAQQCMVNTVAESANSLGRCAVDTAVDGTSRLGFILINRLFSCTIDSERSSIVDNVITYIKSHFLITHNAGAFAWETQTEEQLRLIIERFILQFRVQELFRQATDVQRMTSCLGEAILSCDLFTRTLVQTTPGQTIPQYSINWSPSSTTTLVQAMLRALNRDFPCLPIRDFVELRDQIYDLLKKGVSEGNEDSLRCAVRIITQNNLRNMINMNVGNWIDCAGYRALHWVATSGNITAIRILADAPGLNANIKNVGGWSPLHSAICWLSSKPNTLPGIVTELLRVGADPNGITEDKWGNTPLHTAVYYLGDRGEATYRVLLAGLNNRAADPYIPNRYNQTVIQYAASCSLSSRTIQLLQNRGALPQVGGA